MKSTSKLIGNKIYSDLKFANKVQTWSKTNDPFELILKNTWKPWLAVLGASGIPKCKDAGNVLRCETKLWIGIRIPPSLDPLKA